MSELTGGSDTAGQAAPAAAPATGNPAAAPATGNPAAVLPAPVSGTSWRDSLPDDLKSNATLGNFKEVSDLAKAHVHAQSLIGKKGVFVPGENASPEEVSNFYKSIGMPDADKYAINAPKDREISPEFMTKFKEAAMKAHVLPKQAQELMDWYISHEESIVTSRENEYASESKAGIEGLKKEWGAGYDKELSFAKLAVAQVGGDEFKSYLQETGLGNSPQVIKLMAKVGKMLGEDKLSGQDNGSFGQTPAEIQAEINKIMSADVMTHPYFNSNKQGHKEARAQMDALRQKLHGN